MTSFRESSGVNVKAAEGNSVGLDRMASNSGGRSKMRMLQRRNIRPTEASVGVRPQGKGMPNDLHDREGHEAHVKTLGKHGKSSGVEAVAPVESLSCQSREGLSQ